jgi:glycosyltransferase involved in cell wall biosynthesis
MGDGEMASIYFVGPYKPIMCGIADYTSFITRKSPAGRWGMLSFDLDKYGVPLTADREFSTGRVWYGIPDRRSFSAPVIQDGLKALVAKKEDSVLWFQHEFGIWPDNAKFVDMLRDLDQVKVVSLHTLHFQSSETTCGLRRNEYSFLRLLLPHTDAITVFSDGVYQAVTRAFPEHRDKVHVLRHGIHLNPIIARMSRAEAKVRIHEYLVYESGLDQAYKASLKQQRVFLDADTFVIGITGFITASKGINLLYHAQYLLQQMLPRKRIIAVYAGALREADNSVDSKYAAELRTSHNSPGQFFLETYLPEDVLPILLRALDTYFYWPSDCTQSGILAHGLGAGATIACRDMEGVGETVRMAGGVAFKDFELAITGLKELVLNPELRNEMSEKAVKYAEEFSWRHQAFEHFKLAERLCLSKVQRLFPAMPFGIHTDTTGEPSLTVSDKTPAII